MESNRDIIAIFESITDAIFFLDTEWRFTYLNSEAERVIVRKREELLGKNVWDEFPDAVGSRFYREYRKAMEGRITVEFEEYYPPLETWVEVKAYPSEAGLLIYFREINNRKQMEEDPRGSERRLRTLLIQYSSDIVTILEEDGRVRFQSPAIEHVLGYDPEDLVGQNIFEYIHPDDRQRTYATFVETVSVPSFHGPVEYRFRHKDGTWRYLQTSAHNLLHDPEVKGIVGNSQDVTERKRTEEKLQASEAELRALFASMNDVVLVFDAKGRCLRVVSANSRLLYKPAEEQLGKTLHEIFPAEQADLFLVWIRSALETQQTVRTEYRLSMDDGERWFSANISPMEDRVVWVLRDITERKKMEETLRESEERFRSLIQNAPDVITLVDADNIILYDSPAVERILGYGKDERIGTRGFDYIHPDDLEKVKRIFSKTLESSGIGTPIEYRLRNKDGSWRYFEAIRTNLLDDPAVGSVVINYRDVTERKKAEEALRASEERYRALMEQSVEAIYLFDSETKLVLESNAAFRRLMGYAEEELLGMHIYDFIVHDNEDIDRHVRRSLKEKRRHIGERQYRRKDGSVILVDTSASVISYGGRTALCAVSRDVTERKETEEALRRSEERFRSLVHNSYDVITVLDAQGTILYQSPSVRRVLGGDPEEKIGKSIFETGRVHREDLEKVRQAFAEAMANPGVPSTVEYRIRHADGSWRYIDSVGVNLLDDPSVTGVVVNYRDITERKQAEERLRRSEERHRRQARELALLHEVRTALAQELDPKDVFRTVVEAVARTYGYTLVSAYLFQDGDLVLQHQVGYERVIERVSTEEGVMGRVARTGRSVLLGDVRADPAFLDAIKGIVSEVCVPLFDEDKVAGVLNVESTNDVKLTEDDLRLMSALGEHVGIAIGRARLYTRVRESEERFRSLVQNSSDLITLYDADGIIRYASPALERMLGYEPEERIGETSFGLLHPDDAVRAREVFAEALRRPGVPISAEVRAQHRDGSWRCIEAVGTNLLDHPSVEAVVLNGRDITDRKEVEARLQEAERRYRTLVERIPAITYIQEPGEPSRTTYISPQYEKILGYSIEECLGDPEHWTAILHPDDRERVLVEDRRTNATGDPFSMEYRQFAKDGSVVWIKDEATAVRDEEGRLRYWIGVQIDITERKMLEERLEYQAFHDPLTGLPNRALFMDRLEHALWRAEREKDEVAVLFLDVDNLKVVNDTLGHEAGDWLLVAVTGRLRTCLRPADTVARLSGDEFAILLEVGKSTSRATQVAERVAEALRVPVALKERETFITASIGIALSGAAFDSASGSVREQAESLLRQADLAMYRAKNKGKAHHEVFDPSMNASAFERLEMGNDLRRALERGEFRVCYQPKMQLCTNLQQSLRFSGRAAIVATPEATKKPRIIGMEALVRWEHPERGLMSPEEFIPVAEESGLIVPIGRKVLEEACRQARAWQDLYPSEEPLVTCVNISARQFQHPELAQDVARVLQRTGLEPRCLELEITESVVMEDAHATLEALKALELLGVGLAIDDFGTGYSSLSYLKRFPVSFLKIDRSFVEPLGENPEDAMIVSGIISLAHTLGMKVVAEGVETAAQLAYLQGLGCDMAQGNYFYKPLQAEEVGALLAKNSR